MSQHQQTDWIGYSEFPRAEINVCPVCNSIIMNLHDSAGRPSVYCSDSCKMKAYRQRNKQKQALRNSIESEPLYIKAGFKSHEEHKAFIYRIFNISESDVVTTSTAEAFALGKVYVSFGDGVVTVNKPRGFISAYQRGERS